MPDHKPGDTGTPAADKESGAGYGNNALTDDVGQAGEDQSGDEAEDAPEAHPS